MKAETEIKIKYFNLKKQIVLLQEKLEELREEAKKKAPQLLVKKTIYKWDYKPKFHKLNSDFFTLNQTKITHIYKSALGGEDFTKKYGLKLKINEIYGWKNLKEEKSNENN